MEEKKPAKGDSLLVIASDYVVLDLETTGLDPVWDDIIEIGIIQVADNEIASTFQSLVKPSCKISGFITQLTGITNGMLEDAPDIDTVLPAAREFIGSHMVVAHNANFDVNFLTNNCQRILGTPFTNNFLDTMRLSRRLFRQHRRHRLIDLVERFQLAEGVDHRALSDAHHTKACYDCMKQHMAQAGINAESLSAGNKGR